MSIDKVIQSVTPEIYRNMQNAIATGKWPNGAEVTPEQRENCLQIVIAYDAKHKETEERTGYLPKKPPGSGSRKDLDRKLNLDQPKPIRMLND